MKNLKKFIRESKQNSLLGQKRRKQILFGIIGMFALIFVFTMTLFISPLAAGAMAIVPLLAGIEKKGDEPVSIEDTQKMLNNMYENLKESLTPQMDQKFVTYQNEIKKLIENNITDEKLEAKFTEFKTKMDEVIAGINTGKSESKTMLEQLTDQVIARKEELTTKNSMKLEVKAVSAAELVAPNYNTMVDPNVKIAPLDPTTLLDLIPKYPLGKRLLVKVSAVTAVTVDYQGEGANVSVASGTIGASEVTYQAAKLKAVVRGISREALLEDTSEILNKALANMRAQLRHKLEAEALSGLGATGVPTKIWGIIPQFTTAFSASGIPKVKTPNLLNLLNAMRLQAQMNANNVSYFPNVVVVSPARMFEFMNLKDTLGRPLYEDGVLGGMYTVVPCKNLTIDQLVLLDINTIEMYIGREFEFELVQTSYSVTAGETTTQYTDHENDTFTAYGWFRGLQAMNPVDKAGNIYVAAIDTALSSIAAS